MACVLVRHRVRDYAAWRSAFETGVEMRKAGGEESYRIFHAAGDPDDVVLFFEWKSLGSAREYAGSDELREAMRRAGVVGEPEVLLLEEVERGS